MYYYDYVAFTADVCIVIVIFVLHATYIHSFFLNDGASRLL